MRKKWNPYAVKGMAAATAAAVVAVSAPTGTITVRAEVTQENNIERNEQDENENLETPSNASPSNAGIMPTAITASGQCGSNVSWSYDDVSKTMTVSGEGDMWDYDGYSTREWYDLDVEKLVIEDGVTTIGKYSFCLCGNLTTVILGDDVTTIKEEAFNTCSNLKTIYFGKSLTDIGKLAFSDCSSLESLTISDSVKTIGEMAFNYCSNLSTVVLGKNVKSIGRLAFWYCSNLSEITIGENIETINEEAFEYCTNLKKITIKAKNPPTLGNNIFSNCGSITGGVSLSLTTASLPIKTTLSGVPIPASFRKVISEHAAKI